MVIKYEEQEEASETPADEKELLIGDVSMDELTKAGQLVAQAINNMLSQELGPIAVASALLGGSLGILSATLSKEQVLNILQNAANGVKSGDLDQFRQEQS